MKREQPASLRNAKRCLAKTRRGTACQCPAMPNGRCRIHGGKSSGAPCGEANGSYRHGGWTHEAVEARRNASAILREVKALA